MRQKMVVILGRKSLVNLTRKMVVTLDGIYNTVNIQEFIKT